MDLVQVQHKFLYKPLLDSQFTGNEYIYCHNSKLKNPNQLIAFLFGLVYPWAWRALYFFYSRKLFLEFFPNHDLPPSPIRLMHPKNKIIKQRKTYWWIKKKKKKEAKEKENTRYPFNCTKVSQFGLCKVSSLLPSDSSFGRFLRLHQHKYWGTGPSSPITQVCSATAANVNLSFGSAKNIEKIQIWGQPKDTKVNIHWQA